MTRFPINYALFVHSFITALQARMKKPLEKGSDRPQGEVSTSDREADLDEALAFGVSRGGQSKPELLRELVVQDITHGYALPIPLSPSWRP